MRAVVAGNEPDRVNEARRILLSEGVTCEADDAVAFARLQDSLAAAHPNVVLVFCDGDGREGLAAIETAHHLVAGPVLAVGEDNVALMREAMRAGAREYLDVKNLGHELSAALTTIESADPEASKRGQIISVFSPIAGAGATTIAVNLAVSLAKSSQQQAGTAALVNVSPPPSDLSLLLDLTPKHTLADMLRHRDRLDRRLIAGAMTQHASGLHVLPQAGYSEELALPPHDIDAADIRRIFTLLRKSYEFTVVDLGHDVTDVQFEAVRLSDFVLLPALADVPALRRLRWALDTAISLGINRERFQVVINRFGGKNQVAKPKVEEALHTSVLTTIGEHGPLLTAARNEGVAAVEHSAAVAAAFNSLVKTLRQNMVGAPA